MYTCISNDSLRKAKVIESQNNQNTFVVDHKNQKPYGMGFYDRWNQEREKYKGLYL